MPTLNEYDCNGGLIINEDWNDDYNDPTTDAYQQIIQLFFQALMDLYTQLFTGLPFEIIDIKITLVQTVTKTTGYRLVYDVISHQIKNSNEENPLDTETAKNKLTEITSDLGTEITNQQDIF